MIYVRYKFRVTNMSEIFEKFNKLAYRYFEYEDLISNSYLRRLCSPKNTSFRVRSVVWMDDIQLKKLNNKKH